MIGSFLLSLNIYMHSSLSRKPIIPHESPFSLISYMRGSVQRIDDNEEREREILHLDFILLFVIKTFSSLNN